ncbi:hypothetical protein [Psychroserpens sp.]|uniref:hypothetical protein n=1 Tax=Psychroserpens sp. TaxID=2020870 RepID=UPI001B005323|nr:hypothetical protein [Psychroserpens sp.]MBO6608045.1 hypothetical protein [Psychroserpens sp.]MBO6631538.1 hypothetical protein [Psychroserpens sp.]MBO6655155.1 hypothetical protein [Psychroserpens sp.]MBO6683255.1 hypothetical protein [Psychroserpens sp.]MBO6751418.1 hypothetical protein [Psychroserpens sp.]
MKRFFLALSVLIGLTINTYAQTDSTDSLQDDNNNKSWQFDATPYIWFAGLSSDIAFREQNVPFDAEFKDILENLSFGFLMHAEARKGNLFLMGDLVYMKIKKDGKLKRLGTKTKLELAQTVIELGGGYTFYRSKSNNLQIDALGGLRHLSVDAKFTTGTQERLDKSTNTNDPFIGVRLRNVLNKWINSARIDVGGFGIGTDFSWKSNLFLGYKFSELFTTYLGVQAYGINYEEENYAIDLVSSGLVTGLNFNF